MGYYGAVAIAFSHAQAWATRSRRHTFGYLHCCKQSDYESIHALTEGAVAITAQTFREHVDLADLRDLEKRWGYDTGGKRGGLRLNHDFAVGFFKGVYRGRTCYYVSQSGVEYIFTENR
jgi:hypothetical protein